MPAVSNRNATPPQLNGAFLVSYDGGRAEPSEFAINAFRHDDSARGGDDLSDSGMTLHVDSPEPHEDEPVRYELIVDQNNLLPFDFLRTGDRLGRAVVKIQRGDGAAGTGFLVAPGVLLTNHHVLPDAGTAAAAKALANYETNPSTDPAGVAAIVPLDPEALFVTNQELDFTFCGVGGLDFLGVVPPNRNSLCVAPPEYVNIIQHPRGRPKEVAIQDNRVVKADNMVVHYSCDTEPGSSGSPVFNNQWRLVALHHASVPADDGTGAKGDLPRYLNEGIRLSAIAVWLESPRADEAHAPEHIAKLRTIFGGIDPQIGYFGALGRTPKSTSAAEVVVESYHNRDDDLDLAFWNLRSLRTRFRRRLREIGWAVAEMGVDLWCFAHVSPDFIKALSTHLKERFNLDYRALVADPSPSRPITILHRVGDGIAVARLADVTAPGTSISRPCIRVRTTNRAGVSRSFVLVPIVDGGWPRGERPGSAVPVLDIPSSIDATSDRLILGDGLRPQAVAAVASSDESLRFAAGDDGAILWRTRPESGLGIAFVSPNLRAARRPESVFRVSHDRPWPPAVRTLRAGRPLVMRIPLQGAPTPAACSVPPRLPDPPAPPDEVLERLLREILAPIVAKMVAEARH